MVVAVYRCFVNYYIIKDIIYSTRVSRLIWEMAWLNFLPCPLIFNGAYSLSGVADLKYETEK